MNDSLQVELKQDYYLQAPNLFDRTYFMASSTIWAFVQFVSPDFPPPGKTAASLSRSSLKRIRRSFSHILYCSALEKIYNFNLLKTFYLFGRNIFCSQFYNSYIDLFAYIVFILHMSIKSPVWLILPILFKKQSYPFDATTQPQHCCPTKIKYTIYNYILFFFGFRASDGHFGAWDELLKSHFY